MKATLIAVPVLSALLVNSAAQAQVMSSRIDYGSYTIKPATKAEVYLQDRLVDGVRYKMQCSIDNPGQDAVMLAVRSNTNVPVSVGFNGGYSEPSQQGELNPGKNTVNVSGIYGSAIGSIYLINADQDTTLSVTDCFAVAEA